MSRLDQSTENPNEKMPAGKPLDPAVIVPDGDAGMDESDATTETGSEEIATGDEDGLPDDEDEQLDEAGNDLVNVGKFNDPAIEDNLD